MRPSPVLAQRSAAAAPLRPALPSSCHQALQLLLEAKAFAVDLRRDAWEFAVELPSLHSAGVSNAALRWLACQGLIAHALECSIPEKEARQFRQAAGLMLTAQSCFVLTEQGTAVARDTGTRAHEPLPATPRYHPDLKELWFQGVLVKRFKVPAQNQELILSAFEEEGWPPHLDDPLPPLDGIEPKRRLHDAVGKLNRNQHRRLLHFRGAGDGRGLRWEAAR